jgi:Zn-dependent protease
MGLLSLFSGRDFTSGLYLLLAYLVVVVVAITIHEFMHAWSANYLGDNTAKYSGRITLNPIAHLEPIGSLMLIFFGFGWGKPVPVNPNNFQNPRVGNALVSLAGPFSNLALALFLGALYKIPQISSATYIGDINLLYLGIWINLLLMLFNLLPIPPLDGSKFFALFFPKLEDPRLQAYGILIVLGFVFLGGSVILNQIVIYLSSIIIGV